MAVEAHIRRGGVEQETDMEEEAAEKKKAPRIDPAWEFTAPKYHDFLIQETEDERVSAELWFAKTMCYSASRKNYKFPRGMVWLHSLCRPS